MALHRQFKGGMLCPHCPNLLKTSNGDKIQTTHTNAREPTTALWLRQIWPRVCFWVPALPAAVCDIGKYASRVWESTFLWISLYYTLLPLKLILSFEYVIDSRSALSLVDHTYQMRMGASPPIWLFFVGSDFQFPAEEANYSWGCSASKSWYTHTCGNQGVKRCRQDTAVSPTYCCYFW